MATLVPGEERMWEVRIRKPRARMTAAQIDEKYESGEKRIVTEVNREKLPNFVKAMDQPNYISLRPFYQRRERWDNTRRSRLIESFIMNIPVPPVFLYEKAYNQYEVMDGQQRISALQGYYKGEYKLSGLSSWPELNGMTYSQLPEKVRAGLDRRSLSSIVLMKESAPDEESALLLKRLVFERLNTGGIKLTRQEIRNCLFQGPLNEALRQLSETPMFREALRLSGSSDRELLKNTMYSKMADIEMILRFFALRHSNHLGGSLQQFLDRYMIRSMFFTTDDIRQLRTHFTDTLSLVHQVYGEHIFCAYLTHRHCWSSKPHKSIADAELVAFSDFLPDREKLVSRRIQVLENTQNLFTTLPPKTFTGTASTNKDVIERIEYFRNMIRNSLK